MVLHCPSRFYFSIFDSDGDGDGDRCLRRWIGSGIGGSGTETMLKLVAWIGVGIGRYES